MTLVLPERCILCDEHDVQAFCKGPSDARIVVVTNRKNSTKFQQALELELTQLGLDVNEIYFTPVIKCTSFDITLSNAKLKAHAKEYIIPELERVKPDLILALGNEALLATTGKSGITKYRGKPFDGPAGSTVLATISPSAVNRNPGQKPGYLGDLRLFVNRAKGRDSGIAKPKYMVADTKEKFAKLLKVLDRTDEIFIDIETKGGEYYEQDKGAKMISLAATCIVISPLGVKQRTVFALPLAHVQSPWRNQWRKVLHIFGQHCKNIRKTVAHNGSFDLKWLQECDVFLTLTFDTMLAIALLNENIQKGLKPTAIARLGVEPWGIDTGDLDKYPLSEVLEYNVLDTWYMYWIKQQLAEELKAQPRLARIFTKLWMPAQNELLLIERRGAWIDVDRLKERKPQAEQNLIRIEQAIRDAAELPPKGSELWPHTIKHLKTIDRVIPWEENFNASQFARWMLFDWCGLPVTARGKDKDDGRPGDPSMAEGVLMALKDEHPVIPHMLDRVTANKHITSFFNPYAEMYDEDHRIHTTFKLAGTVTGRLSSGKADADKISGTRGKMRGVNLQQVPRDPFIRGLFGAPPGWTFVESDYSQIELRVAAYLADETTMKHLYAIGADIHMETAMRVTGLPKSQVTKEIRKKVGKPVNFGFLYGMGAKKFIITAFENYGSTFSIADAEGARKAYFDLYPKLIPWHAKMRRLVNEYGRVESPLGRVRHLPDIYSPDREVRSEAERQAINSPVQGFASDLALLSMIVINHRFRDENIQGYCIGLVHDALNYEIRDDYLSRALPIIKDTMEDMDIVYRKFGTVVDIPIIADVAVGQHWGDKLELTEDQVYDFKLEYKGA